MIMKRCRGFKLGRHIMKFWRRNLMRLRRRSNYYTRLNSQNLKLSTATNSQTAKSTMTKKLLNWSRGLTRRLGRRVSDRKLNLNSRESLLQQPEDAKPPPGYTAVYVGGGEGSPGQRYLVPVIYFNHPLFGELLKEAEEESGFYHPGIISIPCAIAEFEKVRRRIAGGGDQGDKYYRKTCTWDESYGSYRNGPFFL